MAKEGLDNDKTKGNGGYFLFLPVRIGYLLETATRRYDVIIHVYCLMSNHPTL